MENAAETVRVARRLEFYLTPSPFPPQLNSPIKKSATDI